MITESGSQLRRRILIILFILVSGPILNVALAWACVCWSPTIDTRITYNGLPHMPPPEVSIHPIQLIEERGLGITRSDRRQLMGTYTRTWTLSAGWPVHSVYLERIRQEVNAHYYQPISWVPPSRWREGLLIPEWVPWCKHRIPGAIDQRYLPTRPIWRGCVFNSLFYSASLFIPVFGPAAIRRYHRSIRGRCVHCGYPRGSSPICTECGAAHRSK